MTGGSGNSGTHGSPRGLRGSETETTLFHFLDVISWEESELVYPEQREIPRPLYQRGGGCLSTLLRAVPQRRDSKIEASLVRPLKVSAVNTSRGLVGLGV